MFTELQDRVYSPYSNILEVCAVEGKSGLLYPGVRLENISFPLSISAVQGAICSCLGNGDEPAVLYQPDNRSELIGEWVENFDIEHRNITPEKTDYYNPLIKGSFNIMKRLEELAKKAVTSHSDFPVSALIEVDGGYIPGVNVEVPAWSLGLCAERVAVFRAVSTGYTEFKKMHVFAPKGDFSSPCGACRQVLAEWMPNERVELNHGDGTQSTHAVSDLLPFGFTSGSLNKSESK